MKSDKRGPEVKDKRCIRNDNNWTKSVTENETAKEKKLTEGPKAARYKLSPKPYLEYRQATFYSPKMISLERTVFFKRIQFSIEGSCGNANISIKFHQQSKEREITK